MKFITEENVEEIPIHNWVKKMQYLKKSKEYQEVDLEGKIRINHLFMESALNKYEGEIDRLKSIVNNTRCCCGCKNLDKCTNMDDPEISSLGDHIECFNFSKWAPEDLEVNSYLYEKIELSETKPLNDNKDYEIVEIGEYFLIKKFDPNGKTVAEVRIGNNLEIKNVHDFNKKCRDLFKFELFSKKE